MNGYRLVLASDGSIRDGMGLELYDPGGKLLAEIFQDEKSGERTFTAFEPVGISAEVVEWFLGRAKELL